MGGPLTASAGGDDSGGERTAAMASGQLVDCECWRGSFECQSRRRQRASAGIEKKHLNIVEQNNEYHYDSAQ